MSPDQDYWLLIWDCCDHGTSNEPINPFPGWFVGSFNVYYGHWYQSGSSEWNAPNVIYFSLQIYVTLSDAMNTKYAVRENADVKKASKKLKRRKESVWKVSSDPFVNPE